MNPSRTFTIVGLLGLVFFVTLLTRCGVVGLGGGGAINDPRPTGKLLYQGQFQGLSGQAVTGSALIFATTDSQNYILRLEGMSVPVISTLQVQLYSSTTLVMSNTLQGFIGNQNYPFTTSNTVFSTAYIYLPSNQSNYGSAQLIRSL